MDSLEEISKDWDELTNEFKALEVQKWNSIIEPFKAISIFSHF